MEELICTPLTAAHDGRAVARKGGLVVFIRHALPGDTVRVRITRRKKTFWEAEAVEILSPSPDRVTPLCSPGGSCGGCLWRALSYEKQLSLKAARLENALSRIAGVSLSPLPPIPARSLLHTRNKMTFHIGAALNPFLGTLPENSHTPIRCIDCFAFDERLAPAVRAVEQALPEIDPERTLQKAAFRVGSTGEVSVLFCGKGAPPRIEPLVAALSKTGVVSLAFEKENDSRFNRILWGKQGIEEELGGVRLTVSPFAFLQVNHEMAEILYARALEASAPLPGAVLADLCCGVGSIALAAARRGAQVYGAEICPEAVESARENARQNGLSAQFAAADAGEALQSWERQGVRFSHLLVDPPRAGLPAATVEAILASSANRLTYVSCDPETLARDLKLLLAGGFSLQSAQPIDLFPHTPHIETVAHLSRKND